MVTGKVMHIYGNHPTAPTEITLMVAPHEG